MPATPSAELGWERPVYYFISFSETVHENGSAFVGKTYTCAFLLKQKEASVLSASCPEMSCYIKHFLKELEKEAHMSRALVSGGPGRCSLYTGGGGQSRPRGAPSGCSASKTEAANHRVCVLTICLPERGPNCFHSTLCTNTGLVGDPTSQAKPYSRLVSVVGGNAAPEAPWWQTLSSRSATGLF